MIVAAAGLLALAAAGAGAVSGTAGTGAGGGTPAPASFRLADGSAGCNFLASGAIACRAEGAPAALLLEPDGSSRAHDTAVTWTDRTRVLLEGESWWNGDIACRVAGGIVCSTSSGGQITVARDGVGALAPPVQATLGD